MDDTGAPAFHSIPSSWLRPTVLEIRDEHPSWTAEQIARAVDRREPEHAPVNVEEIRAIIDNQRK